MLNTLSSLNIEIIIIINAVLNLAIFATLKNEGRCVQMFVAICKKGYLIRVILRRSNTLHFLI